MNVEVAQVFFRRRGADARRCERGRERRAEMARGERKKPGDASAVVVAGASRGSDRHRGARRDWIRAHSPGSLSRRCVSCVCVRGERGSGERGG